ncbi:C40 family peptidase [Salicibibacter cibarius]|uniref:C40 family peptidase n=1 Tax=Salicibibacter cibarius TaxID=2743000 RepID=A0A7T7CC78_9BACI|nr:NlpC/P60 family protein [Salicibibacter cibarius]QQK76653.1 C40 family peptidase [Salicibibacter cibarius]
MLFGKTGKLFITSSLVTTVMFAPMWSASVSAYAPDNGNSDGQAHTAENSNSGDSSTLHLRGDQGSGVEQLQSDLNEQGYTVQVDGLFGSETENAVKTYQNDQGLGVDGIAGPNTYDALSSGNASSSDSSDDSSALDESSDEEASTPENTSNDDPSNGDSDNENASSSSIATTAESVLGTPYVWGGTTPDGFDSSGFINYVYDQNGIDVSRTHEAMWNNDGEHVTSPSIGDLVFFEGTYDTSGASHSGIYIGDNQMIHAGSEGIVQADITSDYWQDHFLGIKTMQ